MKYFGSWLKVLLLCGMFAAAGSLMASIPPAHAADNSSGDNVQLTLSPTSVHVDLHPGAAKTGEFKVVNSGSRPFTAKVYAAPYRVTDEDYNPAFTGGGAQTQISRWIKFSQNEYVLEPNQVVTIRYTINVPRDIPAAGQYAAIFAETTGDEDRGGTVITKKRVGMIVYGKTEGGNTRQSGELASIDTPWWQQQAPLTAKLRAKNSGNTDFTVKSKLIVKDFFSGATIHQTAETEHAVLPSTTRAIPLEWDGARVGLYNVELRIDMLGNSQTIQRTVLLMPAWMFAAVIILALTLVGGATYALVKKLRAKKKKIRLG